MEEHLGQRPPRVSDPAGKGSRSMSPSRNTSEPVAPPIERAPFQEVVLAGIADQGVLVRNPKA
jgi:hypothetical protein